MTRARWMLGAIGAMATIALVPAMPASAQSDVGVFTEITNASDGSRWTLHGDPMIKTISGPASVFGSSDKWIISRQFDGAATIRNWVTRECAEPELRFAGVVFAAPCDHRSDRQKWILDRRGNGYVITPKDAPDLAVSVEEPGVFDSLLTLKPRPFLASSGMVQDDPASVFQFGA